MSALQLVMTTAGLAAITNAEGTGTDTVLIAEVGVTATPFVAAAPLTALPAEIKRIDTIGGIVTSPTSLNLLMRDDSADSYEVRGFGLYLSDGTLFAAYSSPEVIVQKSALIALLLTIDVAFADIETAVITFGDTSFVNPLASETIKGVVELATQAEVEAGTDPARVVTPKVLNDVVRARTIMGGGLVTGGGNLTGNRVLTVAEASEAEALAGVDGTKAMTARRVKAAIDALVGGAPGALDTLNELAAALGDDPDFAATITNALALKASITYVDDQLAAARTQILVERAGTFVWVGYDQAGLDPATMVLANGQMLDPDTDPRLFARFGTTFGGDGVDTFGVPEVRGEFFRALDLGRGIDAGRTHGSFQDMMIQQHNHSIPANQDQGTGNGYVEDAEGNSTPRSTFTGNTGGAETRPRNVAWPVAIWR